MVKMYLKEPVKECLGVEMEPVRRGDGDWHFLKSTKTVTGIDDEGDEAEGTLIFVYYVSPDKISGITE